LKVILSSPPILAYPDFNKPFELHTDFSILGLDAILYQQDGDHKRVVAYASRSLSKSERQYSAFKLEFLAFKWAITDKFRCYLAGKHFKCYTDNNPLTHILTSPKLDATGQRWAAALGEFDFELFYRPGASNVDADALSRYPYQKVDDDEEEERIKMDTEVVRTMCSALMTSQPLIDTLPAMNLNLVEMTEDPGTPMVQIEMREIRRKQMEDPIFSKWRIAVIVIVIELMFFRKPKLPIDAMFELAGEAREEKTTSEYMEDIRERMKKTREIVETCFGKAKTKQKYYYDKKVRAVKLNKGDQV
jgi:hypothetical protein